MSFTNKNLGDKPSLVKPIAILVVVLLVIGGVYTFFSDNNSKEESQASEDSSMEELLKVKSSGLDPDERVKTVADVEKVIAKWVENNPGAVIQAISNMQKVAMEEQRKNAQKNIGTKTDELFNDKNSPEYAPEGYDVTLVEFFDYSCGYCKKANSTIEELIDKDNKVRIIYKEFPILGEPSHEMARVAIAVNMIKPSAYRQFHNNLMKSSSRGTDAAISAAVLAGVNKSTLKSTLKNQSSEIEEIIGANLALGQAIGVSGTPGFVIGEELIPGALGIEAFEAKIAQQRAK